MQIKTAAQQPKVAATEKSTGHAVQASPRGPATKVTMQSAGYRPLYIECNVAVQSSRRRQLNRAVKLRDDSLPHVSAKVLKALSKRLNSGSLGHSEELGRAFEDFASGHVTRVVTEHLVELRAILSFASDVFDDDRTSLIRLNIEELPGLEHITAINKYGSRGLSMVSGNDSVVLPPDASALETQLLGKWRQDAGLPTPKYIMSKSEFMEGRREFEQAFQVQSFYRDVHSPERKQYALQETWEEKNYAMSQFKDLAPAVLFMGASRDLNHRMVTKFPVVAKHVRSAGGVGVKVCKTSADLREFLAGCDLVSPIQLQEFIDGTDVSMQFYVTDDGPVIISNSDQIMRNGTEHAGNRVMSECMDKDDRAVALEVGKRLFEAGYRGFMACDLMKPKDGSLARVIEANLRMGGVTLPMFVASQLGHGSFVNKQIVFDDMDQLLKVVAHLGITDGRAEGLIPYTSMILEDGRVKADVLCVSEQHGTDVVKRLDAMMQTPVKKTR